MNVAINGRFLLPRLEGIGHYTHELIKRLVSTHPEDVFHVILDREVNYPIFDQNNVVRHIVGPPARHPVLWYYWYEIQIPGLLNKIKADVFFSPDGFLSCRTDIPTLFTIHDLAYKEYPDGSQWSHRKYLEYFMPRYVHRADKIAAVSDFTASRIINYFPKTENKLHTITNGLMKGFKPLNTEKQAAVREQITGGKPYFLFVGAIHPRKNVVRLIKAYASYRRNSKDNICLVLAGRLAWHTNEIEEALSASEYAEDIVHLSHIDDLLSDLMGSATALCYLSLLEGFGLPVLEAMACGVPVITSEKSAMSEVGGDAVIIVNPLKVEDIVSAMKKVRTDIEMVNNCAWKGLKRAQLFDWDRSAEKIYNLLSEICVIKR